MASLLTIIQNVSNLMYQWACPFVCSFVLSGQGSSLLWTPVLRPYSDPVRLPRDRKGIGGCVRCVLATCGEGRLSRSEQLVGCFYSVPLLHMAYCSADSLQALPVFVAQQHHTISIRKCYFPSLRMEINCNYSKMLFAVRADCK